MEIWNHRYPEYVINPFPNEETCDEYRLNTHNDLNVTLTSEDH